MRAGCWASSGSCVRRHSTCRRTAAGLDDFNKNLSAVIESHRSLQFEPPTKATRGGWQTGEILSGEGGPVAAFRQCLEGAVSRYIAGDRGRDGGRSSFSLPCAG